MLSALIPTQHSYPALQKLHSWYTRGWSASVLSY